MCSLRSYPELAGPVVMTYLEDQRVLAACGVWGKKDHSCYQLSPDGQPSLGWQPLQELLNNHCSQPYYTRNHYFSDHGWLIIGQEDGVCGNNGDAAISTELLTPQLQWIQTPIVSPYSQGFPYGACSVAINSSTVIVTGGRNGDGYLASTWMLDLTDFTWTQLQDMPRRRYSHGCTLTSTGDIIIAGGVYVNYLSSVYTYNLMTNTWTQAGDLPADMINYDVPVMFLWNNHPIILEYLTSNIWRLDGDRWIKMESKLGAIFDGAWDTATIVPAGLFTC